MTSSRRLLAATLRAPKDSSGLRHVTLTRPLLSRRKRGVQRVPVVFLPNQPENLPDQHVAGIAY
jgi:hypothetical protein